MDSKLYFISHYASIKNGGSKMEQKYPLNKPVAFFMAMFHLGAFAAPFFFTWRLAILAFCVWATVSSVGVGVCYHRLLTHRGYECPKWVEYAMATIALLSQQGLAIIWVALHRIHHKYTEVPGKDPHTPRDGRWWAHMDWILHPNPEFQSNVYLNKLVPDLLRQPFYRKRYMQWLPTTVLALLCFAFGGFPAVLWGVALPVVVGLHQTWLVNSATHLWGYRWFNTKDDSRNNWWIALFAMGEGNHNSHHDDPPNPKHALKWWEPDLNWYIIWIMTKLGVFTNLKKAHHSPEII